MIKFTVLPREMLDISKPENVQNYANFLAECSKLNVQLSIQNIQGKSTSISAEPEIEKDYETVITFIDKYFSILSVEIDRITKSVSTDTNMPPIFSDSKLNQQFELLAKAVQSCIDNDVPANGYILSAIQSIDARLEHTVPLNFSQFDIIDFNFGTNMPYEISGGHIWSVVLKKEDNESFIVPLVKNPETTDGLLQITEDDIFWDTAIIKMQTTYCTVKYARWISNLRANKVIGKVHPDFIKKIQMQLSSEYNHAYYASSSGMIYEKALLEVTSSAIEETSSKTFSSFKEKMEYFLREIHYSFDDEILQSFLVGINLEKLTFNYIAMKVYPDEKITSYKIVQLKKKLKESFVEWLTSNCPNLKNSLPGISFIQLIKLMKKYL